MDLGCLSNVAVGSKPFFPARRATGRCPRSARISRPGRGALTVNAIAEVKGVPKQAASNSKLPDPTPKILEKLKYEVGKPRDPSAKDVYRATAAAVREQLLDDFEKTQDYWREKDPKFVYYLSAEFLMGRTLTNAVNNLGLEGPYASALNKLGYDMETIQEEERDASLGNGGLGRLAACFLDSIATLNLPGWGYGIRYRYGMFKQVIDTATGYQTEWPDIWLTNGNPWEIKRSDIRFPVSFGGKTVTTKEDGKTVTTWEPTEQVWAQCYDNPIPGFKTKTTGNLRLWDALPMAEFDLSAFNKGDYEQSVHAKDSAEAICAVLYPNDSTAEGKELRLKQQYFFVSASMQDVLSRFKAVHGNKWELLPEKAAFQMNDTHPTIGVAELMRLLVDVEGLDWDVAWTISSKCLNYTNHTVMPEALEKWPVKVMRKMLPRHMEIIEIIDAGWKKFLDVKFAEETEEVKAEKIEKLAIVQENEWVKGEMLINMAYLACVGSAHINGVAAIHTEILKDTVLEDMYKVFPEKFQNKTNGVTPRRWLAFCNPELSSLITETLGSDAWINDSTQLRNLTQYASDKGFQAKWRAVKKLKKAKLAELVKKIHGDEVDLDALFDIQIKRIHEYKRQHLNVLSVIHRYKQIKAMTPEERKKVVKRVVMIGGKAASAYDMAKRMIRLVTAVGNKINNDPDTRDYLRLYFLPDYNVSLAETIIPGAELSQHISTAGTEASGTSNMKFQMNGCLIIGTMDGANVEIGEETGFENLFVFGIDAKDLHRLRKERKDFKTDPRWDELMADIEGGMFGDKEYFKPLVDGIHNMKVGNDWFLLANDFATYMDAQEKVDECYADQEEWTRRSIMYTAGSGFFSSDRTIDQYAKEIWNIQPVKVPDN